MWPRYQIWKSGPGINWDDLVRNENLVERSDQNRLRYDRIRPDKTRSVPNKFHRRSTTLLPKDSPPCWRTSNSVDSRSILLHSFPNGPFLHLFHLFFFFYSQIFSNCFVFILIFCRSTGWTAPPAWQQRLKPLLENSSSQFLACTRSQDPGSPRQESHLDRSPT